MKHYNSSVPEPFLNGSTAGYVEEMYNAWLRDPASVHAVSSIEFQTICDNKNVAENMQIKSAIL